MDKFHKSFFQHPYTCCYQPESCNSPPQRNFFANQEDGKRHNEHVIDKRLGRGQQRQVLKNSVSPDKSCGECDISGKNQGQHI